MGHMMTGGSADVEWDFNGQHVHIWATRATVWLMNLMVMKGVVVMWNNIVFYGDIFPLWSKEKLADMTNRACKASIDATHTK
jgi:hypothetical protein